jgi:hypothetical protein
MKGAGGGQAKANCDDPVRYGRFSTREAVQNDLMERSGTSLRFTRLGKCWKSKRRVWNRTVECVRV